MIYFIFILDQGPRSKGAPFNLVNCANFWNVLYQKLKKKINFSSHLKKLLPQLKRMYRGSTRQGKTLFEHNTNNIQSPYLTSQELLNFHKLAQEGRIEAISEKIRRKRQGKKIKKIVQ